MKNWQNGDIIITRPHDLPFITHYGILVLIEGKWFVLHSIQKEGVTKESLEDVLARNSVLRIEKSAISGQTTDKLLAKFAQYAGRKYDLDNFNCEQFVNEFTKGEAFSYQVLFTKVIIGLFIILIIGWGIRLIFFRK